MLGHPGADCYWVGFGIPRISSPQVAGYNFRALISGGFVPAYGFYLKKSRRERYPSHLFSQPSRIPKICFKTCRVTPNPSLLWLEMLGVYIYICIFRGSFPNQSLPSVRKKKHGCFKLQEINNFQEWQPYFPPTQHTLRRLVAISHGPTDVFLSKIHRWGNFVGPTFVREWCWAPLLLGFHIDCIRLLDFLNHQQVVWQVLYFVVAP